MPLFHPTFIRRQLGATRSQSAIFVLCVALSMVTLVALRGFGASVDRALTRDARALIAADVTVQSNFPFDPAVDAAVADRNGMLALRRAGSAHLGVLFHRPPHRRRWLAAVQSQGSRAGLAFLR